MTTAGRPLRKLTSISGQPHQNNVGMKSGYRLDIWSRSVSRIYSLQHEDFPSRLRPVALALAPQGVLVEQVFGHLVGLGVHAGEVGDVVSQLLDGLHLLIQIVGLQEVTQLRREREEMSVWENTI